MWLRRTKKEKAQVKGSAPPEAVGNCNTNGRCKGTMPFPIIRSQPAGLQPVVLGSIAEHREAAFLCLSFSGNACTTR